MAIFESDLSRSMQGLREHLSRLIVEAGHRRILDLPAGTGELTRMLMGEGREVVAADIVPEAFSIPGQTCVRADLNKELPFESSSFDAIACIEGVEHIENPHLLAREAFRVLGPHGWLYVTTPNILSIRSRLSYLFRGYPNQFEWMIENYPLETAEQPAHINPVGFLELRFVLSRWGFKVRKVQTNQMARQRSIWYAVLRGIMISKGRSAAQRNSRVAAVREILLSDPILYGDHLIIAAEKVS